MIKFEYKRVDSWAYYSTHVIPEQQIVYGAAQANSNQERPNWEEQTLNQLGQEGWELIDRYIAPLDSSQYTGGASYGYPVYFMKRVKAQFSP